MNYLLCERMKEIFLMRGEKSRMREMKRKMVDLDCYFHDEPFAEEVRDPFMRMTVKYRREGSKVC